MPRKDPEKQKEYYQNNKEQKREYQRNYRKINNLNVRRYNHNLYHYYDFETHRQLAMGSGIETALEWKMCHKMGLIPDGIYRNPDQAFGRQ